MQALLERDAGVDVEQVEAPNSRGSVDRGGLVGLAVTSPSSKTARPPRTPASTATARPASASRSSATIDAPSGAGRRDRAGPARPPPRSPRPPARSLPAHRPSAPPGIPPGRPRRCSMPMPGPSGSGRRRPRRKALGDETLVEPVSCTQYSRYSACSMAASTCSDAALMIPVLQACRTQRRPRRATELGDPHELGGAAAAGDVGLDDATPPRPSSRSKSTRRRLLLARGDRRLDGLGELQVVGVRRPGGTAPRSRAGGTPPGGARARCRASARRHTMPMSSMSSRSSPPASRAAATSATSSVGVAAERAPAELDRREAAPRDARPRRAPTSSGVSRHQRAGVGADAVALRAAEQRVDRPPAAFPARSQSAMSSPLSACSTTPRRPW